MILVSALREPKLVKTLCKPPRISGKEEQRPFAPSIILEPGSATEVSDANGELILAKHGKYGVVGQGRPRDLQDRVAKDETFEQAMHRAQEQRHAFLSARIEQFREVNAEVVAAGNRAMRPTRALRDDLREAKDLQKTLGDDELLGNIDQVEKTKDVQKREVDAFASDLTSIQGL